jgi:hypothetical protein
MGGVVARRWSRSRLAALALLALAGCRPGPRAPALHDEPVYQNGREGFRFLVPEGWTQHALGNPPAGPAAQEEMLVEYQFLTSEKPAVLRVALIDLPPADRVEAYLARSLAADGWREKSPADACEVDGVAGTHAVFVQSKGTEETTREVFAFRRGGRVYLFSGIYASADAPARQQTRRAVESLRWKK